MYWISDYNNKISDEVRTSTTVIELISEAHITGLVEYFGSNIVIGCVAESSMEEQPNHYQIKLRHSKTRNYDITKATKKGYYNTEGVAGEFASMMALHFQARFYHSSTTIGELSGKSIQARELKKILRVQPRRNIDANVFGQQERNFTSLKLFLNKIKSVPEKHHMEVIGACNNYNLALREIGIDHEMVFVRLVSAIESMSDSFSLKNTDDPHSKELLALINSSPNELVIKELRDLFSKRKTMLKFTKFIETYSKGYLKGGNYKAKRMKIAKKDLPAICAAIYKARSKYLHAGEHMYLSNNFGGDKYDTDASLGMYIGSRKFLKEEKLPHIEFFEGLIRHCILSRIDELAGK